MQPLSTAEITIALRTLNVAWSAIPGEGLVRVWSAGSFKEAFKIAQVLSKLVSSYKSAPTLLVTADKVQLVLSAKEAIGVTAREVALAEAIDNMLR